MHRPCSLRRRRWRSPGTSQARRAGRRRRGRREPKGGRLVAHLFRGCMRSAVTNRAATMKERFRARTRTASLRARLFKGLLKHALGHWAARTGRDDVPRRPDRLGRESDRPRRAMKMVAESAACPKPAQDRWAKASPDRCMATRLDTWRSRNVGSQRPPPDGGALSGRRAIRSPCHDPGTRHLHRSHGARPTVPA